MKKFFIILCACIVLLTTSCGKNKYDKALDDYERVADELVEARKANDIPKVLELTIEFQTLGVKSAHLKAEDMTDAQKEHLQSIMKKFISGGYQEMIENMTAPYKQTE